MKLKSWSKDHTIGLLIGIGSTIVFIPIVIFILSQKDGVSFSVLWERFTFLDNEKTRILSLASISNLIWFHTFYRKRKDQMSMGVIAATVLNLLIIVFYKFLA